jgi:hypothetical protein
MVIREGGNKTKVLYIGVILCVILLALIHASALADLSAPDTVEIEVARCWRHMLEPNDMLIIARYNISYGNASAQPYYGIDRTFIFTCHEPTDGNITGNATAYPFYNLGYAKGLVGFYWPDDDENKPTWGNLGNITVEGTDLFDSPPSDTFTLTSADWVDSTSPATQREDLRQWLLAQLIFLELDWNNRAADQGFTDRQYSLTATVSGEYQVASLSGESYLALTIDDITSMVPLLFMGQLEPITHTERDYELEQQTAFEEIHGNDTVGHTQEHLSNLFGGIGRIWASTLLVLIGCIAIIVACTALYQRLNHGLLIAYTVILLATPEGLFQMGLMAIFPVVAVLYLSDIFLSKRQA